MNPEGGHSDNDFRDAKVTAQLSNIRAGIDTETVKPSRIFTYEVRGNEVVWVDSVTGEEL